MWCYVYLELYLAWSRKLAVRFFVNRSLWRHRLGSSWPVVHSRCLADLRSWRCTLLNSKYSGVYIHHASKAVLTSYVPVQRSIRSTLCCSWRKWTPTSMTHCSRWGTPTAVCLRTWEWRPDTRSCTPSHTEVRGHLFSNNSNRFELTGSSYCIRLHQT